MLVPSFALRRCSLAALVASLALAGLGACGGGLPSLDGGLGADGGARDGGARDGGALDGGSADGGASDGGGAIADGGVSADGGAIADGGVSVDGGATADGGLCPRSPGAADRARVVVVSHPYDAQARQASTWEAMTLSAAGSLSRAADGGATFSMGRAIEGDVVFTPDGEIGLVAQDDGSLGVFRVVDGGVQVVHAAYEGGFYASRVVVAADGQSAYVLDENFPENGGGLYRVAIGCDGTLTTLGKSAPSKTLRGLVTLPSGELVAAARSILDSPAGDDVHRLDGREPPTRTAGVDAFGDDEAIVSAIALSADGRFVFVADNSEFSGVPNRIAVVDLADGGARRAQVYSPLNDPMAVVPSPFGGVVLVASGYGNALLKLRYDASAAAPLSDGGALAYHGARPALPANAVVIQRGALRGRVLVSENLGVRQVQFDADGGVTDLGATSTGSGNAAIVGIVGVQP